MSKPKVFPPPQAVTEGALVNRDEYNWMYRQSVKDPEGFWGAHGERIDWIRPYTKVKDTSYGPGEISIRWFYDGTLNVSANCVDRHAERTPDKIAILWEGDDPDEDRKFTCRELKSEVCRMANVLKSLGSRKGDRVTIYMPMIPEVAFAMLACARIGAIHSVVFGGFSPHALAGRISDCSSEIVITADEGLRGARKVPLKLNTDKALEDDDVDSIVKKVLVVRRTGADVPWDGNRDVWYHEAAAEVSDECPAVEMDAEDPLFILYTSGSTGKPKGVLHTTGGYLVYASMTHQYVFDYHDEDGYYWITGRVDDVINVSGHRMGTAEWAPSLPKTRSGKIMRRILRRIAANDYADLGDTLTLADPSVVDNLIDNRMNR